MTACDFSSFLNEYQTLNPHIPQNKLSGINSAPHFGHLLLAGMGGALLSGVVPGRPDWGGIAGGGI